jgi:hypothetical protein
VIADEPVKAAIRCPKRTFERISEGEIEQVIESRGIHKFA